MTQECLSELVNIHWKTLSYIERGKYPFSVTTFVRLSKYLQINTNELIDGIDDIDKKHLARVTKAMARKRRISSKIKR